MMEIVYPDFRHTISFLAGVSAFACLVSYFVVSPYFSSRYCLKKYYSTWSNNTKDYYNSLSCSYIHAIIVTSLSLWAVWNDQDGSIESQVLLRSSIGTAAMQISFGYFVADCLIILSSSYLQSDILHHFSSLVSVMFGLTYRGHWQLLILLRLVSEMSTPFVNIRWTLETIKTPKTSTMYVICGFCMTLLFFIPRVFIIPLLWYYLYRLIIYEYSSDALYGIPTILKLWAISAYVVLDSLNIYWGYKIARGFKKHVSKYYRKAS